MTDTDEPTKRCRDCRIVKPVSRFYRNAKYADGLWTICAMCHKKQAKKARDKKRVKTGWRRVYGMRHGKAKKAKKAVERPLPKGWEQIFLLRMGGTAA